MSLKAAFLLTERKQAAAKRTELNLRQDVFRIIHLTFRMIFLSGRSGSDHIFLIDMSTLSIFNVICVDVDTAKVLAIDRLFWFSVLYSAGV